jgi:hypothetical protein
MMDPRFNGLMVTPGLPGATLAPEGRKTEIGAGKKGIRVGLTSEIAKTIWPTL